MSDLAEMLASAKAQGYKEGTEEERPKAFSKGYDRGYQQGRADAFDEIIKFAHEDATTGNMIVNLNDIIQLKEQANETD